MGASAGRIGWISMWIPFFTGILEHLISFGDGID